MHFEVPPVQRGNVSIGMSSDVNDTVAVHLRLRLFSAVKRPARASYMTHGLY